MSLWGGRLRSLILSASIMGVGLEAAVSAAAQVPGGAKASSGTILGRVVDTTGLVLPEAEISIVRVDNRAVLATALSDPEGRFVMRSVPVGGPYELLARKIGYAPAEWPGVELAGGDTLRITFRLPLAPTVLPELEATARGAPLTARRITAAQFDPRRSRNALFVLGRYRPDMLGDPTVCGDPPPQPPWREQELSQARAQTEPGGSFGPRGAPGSRSPRRPWLDSLYNVRTDPYSPYVLRVYLNGIRRDYPGQSPLAVLRDIAAEEIAEMYYADCEDEWVPIDMRYSIFVVLKPPSPEEQRRALQRLMPPDSTQGKRDSVPTNRDSVKRDSR